jgi:hypothetical protein
MLLHSDQSGLDLQARVNGLRACARHVDMWSCSLIGLPAVSQLECALWALNLV